MNKKLLLIIPLILTFLVGCGSIGRSSTQEVGWQLPPTLNQVKGTIIDDQTKEISVSQLSEACQDYRVKDIAHLKELLNITDKNKRDSVLVKEWRDMYVIYREWHDKGGRLHSSGINIYGPVASTWLNEIYLSLARRELLLTNLSDETLKHAFDESAPKETAISKQYTSYGLQGITQNSMTWWYSQNEEYKNKVIGPDSVALKDITNDLDNSTYPFENGIFKDVEVYCLPAEALISSRKGNVQGADERSLATVISKGYFPEGNRKPIRLIMAWPLRGEQVLGHELGHVWTLKHYYTEGLKLDKIIDSHLKNRSPYNPSIPEAWLDDDKMIDKPATEDVAMIWGDNPMECMAEDFTHLFFQPNYPWKTNYPNIFLSDTARPARERLKSFFQISIPNFVTIEPVPRILTNSEDLTIKVHSKPNSPVYCVFGNNHSYQLTDDKGFIEHTFVTKKEKGLHQYALVFSPDTSFSEQDHVKVFHYVE